MSRPEFGDGRTRSRVPVWRSINYPLRRKLKQWFHYAILLVVTVLVFFPIFWMFYSAFRPVDTLITHSPPLVTTEFTLDNYRQLVFETRFPRYLLNSLIVTTGVVVLTTVLATMGGYGLARINIPRKTLFARGILFGYMFPAILLAIPMYIVWSQMGIIDSYIGLILAITAITLPFSIWLLWRFFLTVPYSLEESAQVAGASRFRAFIDIALPMAKPGIIAVSIFSFSLAWGDYTFALIIMSDVDLFPITVGLEQSFLTGGQNINWPLLMAGSSITVIPPLIFVYFLQKYFLQGFSAGGVE